MYNKHIFDWGYTNVFVQYTNLYAVVDRYIVSEEFVLENLYIFRTFFVASL